MSLTKKKNKSTKIKNSFSRNLYQNVFSLDIINDAKHNNAPRASMNTARITNPRTILIEAFAAPDKKNQQLKSTVNPTVRPLSVVYARIFYYLNFS